MLSFLVIFFSLMLGAWARLPQNPQVIRVGFYENPPKIYTDDSGAITGFWPELLRVIAAEHGWQIEWVPGTWSELLVMLENRQIDILPDTLWTEPRAQRFAFNEETVLVSWTRVYTRPGLKIESLLDLEGKRIGALRGSANLEDPEGLRDLLTRLQIDAEIVEMDDYQAIFAALEAGQLDAAITNKDFGRRHESSYRVVRTPIIMQPVRILFAFPKDAPDTPQLIQAIDQSLAAMKADPDSAYYRLQDEYLGSQIIAEEKALPAWIRTVLLIGGGLLLFSLVVGIVSQIQVRARTRALRESEEKFAKAFQLAPVLMSLTRLADGQFIDANQNFINRIGYTREEVIGHTSAEINLFADPEDRNRLVSQLQKQGIVEGMRTRVNTRTGEIRDMLISARPLRIQETPCILIVGIDITEQIRAEQALKLSEEKFRQAFIASPDVMAISRLIDGCYEQINPGFTRIMGYREEEALGRTSLDLGIWVNPQDRQRFVAGLRADGLVTDLQAQFRVKDGSIRYGQVSAAIIDIDGEPHILSITRDVTKQVQAEQTLQRYSERLEVLHTIDRGILAAESPQAIAQAALTGIQRLIPCPYLSVALIDREAGEGRLLAAFRDGEAQTVSGEPVPLANFSSFADLAQGQPRLLPDLDKVPVKSPEQERLLADGIRATLTLPLLVEGELVGTLNLKAAEPGWFNETHIEIGQDVANQLGVAILQARLREQLRRYADELEQRVAERTRDLEQRIAEIEKLNRGMLAMLEDLREANRRYEQASKELQAANAELKAFTYSVSHDLKAPLRGIDGYSRLLLEDYYDQLDEDGRFFLENIRQAAGQMNQLIEDLLAYSRMERRTLAPQPLSLQGLVDGLLLERRIDIQEHGAQIVLNLSCDEITADREGLTAVLRNLIDNALKFSAAAHPPRVEIGSRPSENGCLIWVRDNGIGFDIAYKERIFEIFQRLHPPDAYPGTGIGLAIVQKAMQRMGGRAWAESEPGEGARFYLEIPATDAETRRGGDAATR